jgi:hypothetical protein
MSILRLLHWIGFFDYEPWLEINGAAGSGSVRLDGRFELCLKRDNGDAEKASILRDIADKIATHPDWDHDEAARKDLVGWLYITAHGKEPQGEPQPGDDQ